jgi:PST family polysaccharide transporter
MGEELEFLGKEVASSAMWTGVSTAGRLVMQVGMLAIVARHVGLADYGLMGMVTTVTNFLLNFRDLGTGPALVQRKTLTGSLEDSVFWLNALMGVLLTILVALLSWPVAWFNRQPPLVPLVQFAALGFLVSSLGVVPMSLLQREMKFRKLAFAELGGYLAGVIVAVTLAMTGHGVWSLAWFMLTNVTCTVALFWIAGGWRPRSSGSIAEIKSIAGFSLNLLGFTSVNYWSRNADALVVSRFLGDVAMGLYGQAYNVMMFPIQNITQTLGRVLFPAMSRMQADHERFRSAYLRVCGVIALVTFPLMMGLMVVARPFIATLLGVNWLPMVPVLLILAPVGMLQSVWTTAGVIYTAKGRTDLMFRYAIVTICVLVPCFLIGSRWGIEGVAASYAVANLLLIYPSCAIPLGLIDLDFSSLVRTIWPAFLSSSLMAALTYGWLLGVKWAGLQEPSLQLASSVAFGVMAYLATLYFVRPPAVRELAELMSDSGHDRLAAFIGKLTPPRPIG